MLNKDCCTGCDLISAYTIKANNKFLLLKHKAFL